MVALLDDSVREGSWVGLVRAAGQLTFNDTRRELEGVPGKS